MRATKTGFACYDERLAPFRPPSTVCVQRWGCGPITEPPQGRRVRRSPFLVGAASSCPALLQVPCCFLSESCGFVESAGDGPAGEAVGTSHEELVHVYRSNSVRVAVGPSHSWLRGLCTGSEWEAAVAFLLQSRRQCCLLGLAGGSGSSVGGCVGSMAMGGRRSRQADGCQRSAWGERLDGGRDRRR